MPATERGCEAAAKGGLLGPAVGGAIHGHSRSAGTNRQERPERLERLAIFRSLDSAEGLEQYIRINRYMLWEEL